jgi:hypothetical protein
MYHIHEKWGIDVRENWGGMQSRKQNHNNQDIKSIVFYSFVREMSCFFEIKMHF